MDIWNNTINNITKSYYYVEDAFLVNIVNLKERTMSPKFFVSNAKDLINKNFKKFDGVITSPPYLNGTNYFRNTKLELWFMNFINDEIKPYIHNSLVFQEKNCNITSSSPNNESHYSPDRLLHTISNKIKELDIKYDTFEVGDLDTIFKYSKKNKYSIEILYSLYILNSAIGQMSL